MFRRHPSHSTVVAYLALFLALGGVGYAKFSVPANSVGTKQIRNQAVTLPKISSSARTFLRGARGEKGVAGAPCSPSIAACRGPAGPGAIGMFIDTGTPVALKTLAKVGPGRLI